MRLVQNDCQLKAESIADLVGLSTSAAQRRLKRMRQNRVISSEIAVLDRKGIGNIMTFITGMEIERENYDALSKFRLLAASQQHIQQVYHVTGAVDLIAIITATDVAQYDDITTHIIADNPQIKRIHTNVVLRDLKIGLHVPVPA